MKKDFYKSLSKKYHTDHIKPLTDDEIEAYLIARMPATFAATTVVLREVCQRISCPITQFLDLGAGLGTGYAAAKEIFPTIEKATLIEQNPKMISKGRQFVDAEWVEGDISKIDLPKADLVLLSYSFGELAQAIQIEVLERAWESASVLVVVEPGTPRGFSHILKVRNHLIEKGGHMIAPCPYKGPCPMAQKGDWCHFSVRLERSREHRHLKEAELGWEDEKFSYIAMGKDPARPAKERILRHPQKRSGHVILELCPDGKRTISRKQKELYKWARKAKWGDESH
ncbi:MAG: hypothetical protein K1000chlam2_00058 [Chlamydiae bacterium]|nr:hypothetical protein [Chlamydiota bacterium]